MSLRDSHFAYRNTSPTRLAGVIWRTKSQSRSDMSYGQRRHAGTGWGGSDAALSVWVVEQQEVKERTLAFQSLLFLRHPDIQSEVWRHPAATASTSPLESVRICGICVRIHCSAESRFRRDWSTDFADWHRLNSGTIARLRSRCEEARAVRQGDHFYPLALLHDLRPDPRIRVDLQ